MHVQGMNTHARIDCVPVSQEAFARAPLVFKQELAQVEPDSQHGVKGIIQTTSQKGMRKSVPSHFPYFHVTFGYRQGLLHVIDDESQWAKAAFGRQVVLGLTGQEDEMHGRAKRVSAQSRRDALLRSWEAYDWTAQLE